MEEKYLTWVASAGLGLAMFILQRVYALLTRIDANVADLRERMARVEARQDLMMRSMDTKERSRHGIMG